MSHIFKFIFNVGRFLMILVTAMGIIFVGDLQAEASSLVETEFMDDEVLPMASDTNNWCDQIRIVPEILRLANIRPKCKKIENRTHIVELVENVKYVMFGFPIEDVSKGVVNIGIYKHGRNFWKNLHVSFSAGGGKNWSKNITTPTEIENKAGFLHVINIDLEDLGKLGYKDINMIKVGYTIPHLPDVGTEIENVKAPSVLYFPTAIRNY